MKKIFLTFALSGLVAATTAQAQGYDVYYPTQAPADYYSYNPQPQTNYNPQPVVSYGTQAAKPVSPSAFKQFSIGMDYVMGSPSIKAQDFTLDNPLPGGLPYTGNTDKFDDNIDSINVNVGYRPFRYLGFEAFYQQSLSDSQVKYTENYSADPRFAQADYDLKYNAYGLDAIVYLPLASWFEVLATAGVANYDFTAEAKFSSYNTSTNNKVRGNSTNFDESKVAFRYGGGTQVWLSQRLAFRAMYRYTSIGGDFFDDISEVALGLRYNF